MFSKHNINPSLWGPGCWRLLHSIAYSWPSGPVPSEDQTHAFRLITSLAHVLPCGKCSRSTRVFLGSGSALRKAVQSRESFMRFICEMHNHACIKAGNPTWSPSDCMHLQCPDQWKRSSISNPWTVALVLLLCLAGLVVYMWWYRRRRKNSYP